MCVACIQFGPYIIYASLKPKILVASSGPLSTTLGESVFFRGMECQVLKGVSKGEDWMAKMRRKPLGSRSMAVIIYSFHHLIFPLLLLL
jgi:hypothetical protein